MPTDENQQFAIIAEAKDYDKPLYLHNLTFSRLIDDIVVPYQSKAPFFIDGIPVKVDDLRKIKIIQQKENFNSLFDELHSCLRRGNSSGLKVPAQDYNTRIAALFREAGDDVTSQIIKAFDGEIRPKLKDYIPKREELIEAAFRVFSESMKYFGGGSA
ncbi:MAG: hypothetical protein Q8N09_05540 [Thermodesulfovibrionia bacterium]|nr:hypothetical protein [Thermodesulfovibrionia bacterium]